MNLAAIKLNLNCQLLSTRSISTSMACLFKSRRINYEKKIMKNNINSSTHNEFASNNQKPPSPADLLTSVCRNYYEKNKIDDENSQQRMELATRVEHFARIVEPRSKVTIFGSSVTGFGTKGADADLTVINEKNDGKTFLRSLEKHMSRSGEFSHVRLVMNTRCPVISFHHKESGLQGDISNTNMLALCNTVLLRQYGKVDKRVPELVFAIKLMVKISKISGAFQGFLSSYALVLMVIHFLQQTTPPVVPCLQQMSTAEPRVCEGHTIAFLEDLSLLESRWEHYGSNSSTTGELLLQFLDYYLNEFDFTTVDIKYNGTTKKTEHWKDIRKKLQIKDPFERKRIMGYNEFSGFTKSMRVYANANEHFQTIPSATVRTNMDKLQDYYFDQTVLRRETCN